MENFLYLFTQIFSFLNNVANNSIFLFCVICVSLFLKAFITYFLISRALKVKKINYSWVLIMVFLTGSIFSDLAWIFTLAQRLFFPGMYYQYMIFFIRITWGFYIVQYQALALFIESFFEQKRRFQIHQKIFLFISSIFVLFFFALAFYKIGCYSPSMRTALEVKVQNSVMIFMIPYLMFTSLFVVFWKTRKEGIPKILLRQVKIFTQFIIFPILIADFIQYYPGFFKTTAANSYLAVGISSLLITYSIFHCMRKIMGLRFLNLQNHVMANKKFDFIEDFKNIIDQLSQVTDIKELKLITQYFFQEAFKVPSKRVHLYVRNINTPEKINHQEAFQEAFIDSDRAKIERLINEYCLQDQVNKIFSKSKVIIADEVEFSNFYENSKDQESIAHFMREIAATIFIPIFEKEKIIAYVIIDEHVRLNSKNKSTTFYSNVERDQMAIFANYLANVIKHLQNKNVKFLIKEKKELKEELYLKHQEVAQYKESISSFLANTSHEKVGTIFYKGRRFTFGNQFAHDLIPINLNTYWGHPITKKLKKLTNQVLEYGAAQFCTIEDKKGKKLVASGILNIDKNSVIIHVYYPEVSDILRQKLELIKDPTKFDYLLYLETTKTGKLIDKLIPGDSENLLNFKVNLLKLALGKGAILLDLPEQDLTSTVEILHHISLRENLHVLDLKRQSNNSSSSDISIKLFGINKIFGINSGDEKPLLEKLDKTGTLFIKNINHLDLEDQKHITEFMKYGFFRQFKGDKKTFSDVRIICCLSIDVKTAVRQGSLCPELYNELKKKSISMPSLMSLSEKDFDIVTQELTKQAIKTNELQHIFELTEKEKKKLVCAKPVSFFELKNKILHLLQKKSQQNNVVQEVQFISSYEAETSDPQILEAARLGKHALRDRSIMTMLWGKFKNQNKIANLLGVNRSSVNRRCKEYGLI